MTEKLYMLAGRIQERFPTLDVRTDQCDIVRIYAKRTLLAIQEQGDEFTATFISLEDECDFEATATKILTSNDYVEFENEITTSLQDLR